MISGTSYCRRDGIHVSNNSADVRMEIVAPCISNHATTALCAENDVVMQTQMGGGHRGNPRTLSACVFWRWGDPGVRKTRAPLANLLARLRRAKGNHFTSPAARG